jgi:alpha-beta hydrolase superfamily lysophospholipase
MSTNPQDGSQPTVVLVHGAFADGSSWNEVIKRLQAQGLQVRAPANPLRGISIDSAYIRSFLEQIEGPVLAVAHSYGGAVRSMAERAGAKITEAEGSHVIMISQPQVVAETIMTALAAVSQDMHPTS